MGACVFAVVSELSLHVYMETVWAFLQSLDKAFHHNRSVKMALRQKELATHAAISSRNQRHLCDLCSPKSQKWDPTPSRVRSETEPTFGESWN